MPVLTHDIHDSTRIGDDYRYGCHNKPRPNAQSYYAAPNGWVYVAGMLEMRRMQINHALSTECRYDMSLSDPARTGCQWRGSGEDYDQSVRKEGK